jgi:hypothetical protein
MKSLAISTAAFVEPLDAELHCGPAPISNAALIN